MRHREDTGEWVRGQAVPDGADQNVGEYLRSPVTGRLDITDIFILLIISSNISMGFRFQTFNN